MKTILIIEDDAALRENTAELLELANYKVITAPNGRLGIASALEALPDLIVCDIMMPEVDGYGVLEALSHNDTTCNIPFIFLSAKTAYKEIRMGMNMGADDYLTKPFEEEELLNAIASRIAKAIILNTNQNLVNEAQEPEEQLRSLHELKNFFDDHGEEAHFSKGTILYEAGTRSFRIYLILKGVVKTYKVDKSGKELITSLFKSDDFLGFTSLLENEPYEETAQALEDVTVVGVSKVKLQEVLEHSQHISMELMQLLTNDLSVVKKQLLQMAYSSVRKKTAKTILQFAAILNDTTDLPICIARNDLASVAGIATETLIRTLSEFKCKGLIEIEGRNIRILNVRGLKNIE